MSMKPTRKDAIRELSRALHPNIGLTIFGDGTDFNKIVLDGEEEKKFSSSDIDTKYTEMVSGWESEDYARKRAIEYPSFAEQLDLLWHAIDTGTLDDRDHRNKFYSTLKAVKTNNPKG